MAARERIDRKTDDDYDAKKDSIRRDADYDDEERSPLFGGFNEYANLSDKELQKQILLLENDLAIDENALDEAWQNQAESYYKIAKITALIVSRRDAAKQNLKIEEARADRDIRHMAAQAGDKIAAAEVSKLVDLEKPVMRANEQLLALQHAVLVTQALCTAFEQRGKALNGMSSLYTTSYFQRNSAVGGEHRVKDYEAERNRRGMAEERRRRGG